MPVLEVTLQQGEQVVSTHGELSWMTPNIQMSQRMGSVPNSGPAPQTAEAGAIGGIIGNIMRGQ